MREVADMIHTSLIPFTSRADVPRQPSKFKLKEADEGILNPQCDNLLPRIVNMDNSFPYDIIGSLQFIQFW